MYDAKYIKSVNFKCDVCMTLNISHLMVVLNPNSGVGSGIGYAKIGVVLLVGTWNRACGVV